MTSRSQVISVSGDSVLLEKEVKTFSSPISGICTVILDSEVLLISTFDGEVHIYVARDSGAWSQTDRLKRLNDSETYIAGLCACGDGTPYILTVNANGDFYIWKIENEGKFSSSIASLKLRNGSLSCVTCLNVGDDRIFAFCGGNDPSLYIVQIRLDKGQIINVRSRGRFAAHASSINSIDTTEFAGGIVATASDDRTVRIWSVTDILEVGPKTGDVPHATHIMKHPVTMVRFSKQNGFVATISGEELVIIRVFPDDKSHFFSQPVAHHTWHSSFTSFCWGPNDESIIASVDGDPPRIVKLIPRKELNLLTLRD